MWKWKLNIFLTLLICLINYSNGLTSDDPLVETNVGLIRGLRATDGDYSMFMGIPYATVNETNPFGPSIPHPVFDDVFEAYDDSAICPQTEEFNHTIVGNLDCLHVNIYVPDSANSGNRMPVLVWVYGGGFSIGFSGRFLYGPKFLVRHDIILVTFNYRVGPYGFMCLDTPDVPGNQGLRDQQLALRWLNNNIEAFGGDPNQVTIYGMSAGGSAVDLLQTYGEHDLFDKIIMHSGTALASWVFSKPDTSAPLKLAEELGYLTTDINDALAFLAPVHTNLIIAAAAARGLGFGPCVENEFDNVERFIHDYPINIKDMNATSKSVLLAYNRDESLLIFKTMPPEFYENVNTFYDTLRSSFNFNTEELDEFEAITRHFYIGDEHFSEAVVQELAEFHGDLTFIYPTFRNIQRYMGSGSRNIFCFVFSYDGERNFVKHRLNVTIAGAMHADDVGYIFDVSYMDVPSPDDQLAIDRMTTLWANFVKYGNPIPEPTEQLPVQWLPITDDALHYLELDSEVNVGRRHINEIMTFWDLFYRLNEKSEIGYRETEHS